MAGYDGRGTQFPLVIARGADMAFTIIVNGQQLDGDGDVLVDGNGDPLLAPVDLSSATIAGELYNAAGTVVDTLSSAVSGAGSNVITLSLTDAETAALVGVVRWTLWVTRGGDKRPWLAGKVDIVNASSPKSTAGSSTTLVVDSDVNVTVSVNAVGGGGDVASVNGQTGVVVLDADDIDDAATTHKFATAAQLSAVDTLATDYLAANDVRIVPTPVAEAAGQVPSTDGAGAYELVPVSSYTAAATAVLTTDASADVDDVAMAPSTTLARLASGGIVAATVGEMQTLLGIGATTTANGLVVPPASMFAHVGSGITLAANRAVFSRFDLTVPTSVRYLNWRSGGVVDGDIQYGVVSLSGAGQTTATRVIDSGVIAYTAATTSVYSVDLGANTLQPGSYAVFFWTSSATATFLCGTGSSIAGSLLLAQNTLVGGVGASTFTLTWGSVVQPAGLTLRGDN